MAGYSDSEVLDILWAHRARRQTAVQLATIHGVTRNAILGLIHRIDTALTEAEVASMPDALILAILDRFEWQGLSAEAVAKEFAPRLRGTLRLTRNAVLHLAHLTRIEAWRGGPCRAERPENRTGGMPRAWWAAGLFARGEAA